DIKTLNGALLKTTEQASQAQTDMANGCKRILTQIRGEVSEDTFKELVAQDLAVQSILGSLYQIADNNGLVAQADIARALRKVGIEPQLVKQTASNSSKEDRAAINKRAEDDVLKSEFKAVASFCDENC